MMTQEILEEARRIDTGGSLAEEPAQLVQEEPRTPSDLFLDYGVPALLIGVGIGWYLSRRQPQVIDMARDKYQATVDQVRDSVERRLDRDGDLSGNFSSSVSDELRLERTPSI